MWSYLLLVDVKDSFPGQFIEVESVTLVKVSADRLRVVVDHYGLAAHLSE